MVHQNIAFSCDCHTCDGFPALQRSFVFIVLYEFGLFSTTVYNLFQPTFVFLLQWGALTLFYYTFCVVVWRWVLQFWSLSDLIETLFSQKWYGTLTNLLFLARYHKNPPQSSLRSGWLSLDFICFFCNNFGQFCAMIANDKSSLWSVLNVFCILFHFNIIYIFVVVGHHLRSQPLTHLNNMSDVAIKLYYNRL